jgi:hypothetical protein
MVRAVKELGEINCEQSQCLLSAMQEMTKHNEQSAELTRRALADVAITINQVATKLEQKQRTESMQIKTVPKTTTIHEHVRYQNTFRQPIVLRGTECASVTAIKEPIIAPKVNAPMFTPVTSTAQTSAMPTLITTTSDSAVALPTSMVMTSVPLLATFASLPIASPAAVCLSGSILASDTLEKASGRKEKRVMDYGGEPDVDNYLSQFNLIAEYNGWTDREKAIALAASLKGNARLVLPTDGLARTITFEQLCERLRESFGPVRQSSYHITALNAVTRRVRETVRALVDRLRPMARLAYPNIEDLAQREKLLIEPFIGALTDMEQRLFVRNRMPFTLKEAADAAELYENNHGIEEKRTDTVAEQNKQDKRKVRALATSTLDLAQLKDEIIHEVRQEVRAISSDVSRQEPTNQRRGRRQNINVGQKKQRGKSQPPVRSINNPQKHVNRNNQYNAQRSNSKPPYGQSFSDRLNSIEATVNKLAQVVERSMSLTSTVQTSTNAEQTRPKTLVSDERLPTVNSSPCYNCGQTGHWRNECLLPKKKWNTYGQGNGEGRGPVGRATCP